MPRSLIAPATSLLFVASLGSACGAPVQDAVMPVDRSGVQSTADALVLTLQLSRTAIREREEIVATAVARNALSSAVLLPACPAAAFRLRITSSDGATVDVPLAAGGCKLPNARAVPLAVGDSIVLAATSSPSMALPAGQRTGVFRLRLIYDSLTGTVLGPEVPFVINPA